MFNWLSWVLFLLVIELHFVESFCWQVNEINLRFILARLTEKYSWIIILVSMNIYILIGWLFFIYTNTDAVTFSFNENKTHCRIFLAFHSYKKCVFGYMAWEVVSWVNVFVFIIRSDFYWKYILWRKFVNNKIALGLVNLFKSVQTVVFLVVKWDDIKIYSCSTKDN